MALKPQQNRATAFDTHSQSFIKKLNIGPLFMLRAMALMTFPLNEIVENLFHSLVTDGINDAAKDTSTRTVRLYI